MKQVESYESLLKVGCQLIHLSSLDKLNFSQKLQKLAELDILID
jgi:hypothetical protein